jgi:sarcosine oxidase subunit beta
LTALGYDHEEWLDAGQLRRLVPYISRRCVGAIVCRGDGSANPFRTVKAFRRAAEQAGAEFRDGHRVLGLEHTGSGWCVGTEFGVFRSERLVNCAGAWGNVIANLLGETVPLAPEAFMLMITERVAPFLGPVVGAAGRTLSFKQFDNGTLLIGGGHRGRADRSNNRTTLSVAGLRASARTVGELFPQLGGVRVVRCWAGIEGVTPDKLPVIGPSRRAEGAYHVFGFSGHGFQLAPVTGRIVTDWVLRGDSPLPIEAFAVDRFDPAASKDALAPATRRCGPRSATARSSS